MSPSHPSKLRARFISRLEERGFTQRTVRNYVQCVKQYQDWARSSPVHMSRDSVHRYLAFLRNEKKLAARTINIHLYALKGFCEFFLPDAGIMEPFKRMRTPRHQPKVLSPEDVSKLINAAPSLKGKAMIITLYSSGIRLDECLNLRITDIDSTRMVLHISRGKGLRERNALLSPTALQVLRAYYLKYRPRDFLFPGRKPDSHLSSTAVATMIRSTALRAHLATRVSAHILRHSFATHLLERGESLLVIQRLLGHVNLSSTAIYTQVSTRMLQAVSSPLDVPPQKPEVPPVVAKRRPGRPKGSKNKPRSPRRPKPNTTRRRGPGRPKGSRNKKSGATKGGRK